MWCNIPLQVFN
jgi:hypothetical protein